MNLKRGEMEKAPGLFRMDSQRRQKTFAEQPWRPGEGEVSGQQLYRHFLTDHLHTCKIFLLEIVIPFGELFASKWLSTDVAFSAAAQMY